MKKKLIIFLLIPLFISCISVDPTIEELTMSRIPYNGTEIRIDGYFESPSSQNTTSNLIFYKNGIVLYFAYSNEIKDFYHSSVNNEKYVDIVRRNRSSWRVFQITNDTIKVQGWLANDINTKYYLINTQLTVINDTTLCFINKEKSIYHFKKLNPKPDSTNVYIK